VSRTADKKKWPNKKGETVRNEVKTRSNNWQKKWEKRRRGKPAKEKEKSRGKRGCQGRGKKKMKKVVTANE